MPRGQDIEQALSKGQRTAARILDVAEALFARQGYDGTSLRQIAQGAGIKEPGLYNHFSGKPALYEAVLQRALDPMLKALDSHLEDTSGLRDDAELPDIMTDLLLEHPQMAALFYQCLQGDADSPGNKMVSRWLQKLFAKGMRNLDKRGTDREPDRASRAINLVAMFNLTTGYFLSERVLSAMDGGSIDDPDNITRQKQLLRKVIRAISID